MRMRPADRVPLKAGQTAWHGRRAMQQRIDRTPGIFVNGTPLREFGEAQWKALVEQEFKKAGTPEYSTVQGGDPHRDVHGLGTGVGPQPQQPLPRELCGEENWRSTRNCQTSDSPVKLDFKPCSYWRVKRRGEPP